MDSNIEYGKRETGTERIVWAVGTIDGEEINEVVKLPRSFMWGDLIEDLCTGIWWATSNEVHAKFFTEGN